MSEVEAVEMHSAKGDSEASPLLDPDALPHDWTSRRTWETPRLVMSILGVVIVVCAVTLVVGTLAAVRPHSTTCVGLPRCPDFPAPYADRIYPTEYKYTGTFPTGFVWGLGTAAYQIEGAYNEDGRGASIWDTYTGANTVGMPGSVCDEAPCPISPHMVDVGATGNVACDFYHQYPADVALMQSLGVKEYRFSISWPRVVPTGKVSEGVNEAGIDFYNALLDTLEAANITPYVTLYHWDLPQALFDPDNGTEGWFSHDDDKKPMPDKIVPHFVDYADLCFSRFGNRIKHWVTFNEPWTFIYQGVMGNKAPGDKRYSDMTTWPWVGGHNVLLAHAAVVALYRSDYASGGGLIGMTNNIDWHEPKSYDPLDVGAAERMQLFQLGWFADPLYFGDYPTAMRKLLDDKLPTFTAEQKKSLKGSADFFGLNHYGTSWATHSENKGYCQCYADTDEEGLLQAQSHWLFAAGWGLRKLLNWIHRRYNKPDIWITEGGWSLAANTVQEGVPDLPRAQYYANYTSEVLRAVVEDGVAVKAYFAWSLMDNFEWEQGYGERFGVIFNDYKMGRDLNAPTNQDAQPTAGSQVRTPKDSACWFSEGLWNDNTLRDPASVQCSPL